MNATFAERLKYAILPQGRLFLSGMTHLFDIGNYAQAS